MSHDLAKKLISKKLRTDPDFCDRVADYLLCRDFLDAIDDQEADELTQNQNGENCACNARNEGATGERLQGYEYWVS